MRWEGLLACKRCMRRGVLHVSFTAAGTKVEMHRQKIQNQQKNKVLSILKIAPCSILKSETFCLQPMKKKEMRQFYFLSPTVFAHTTQSIFKRWHDVTQRADTCFHQRSHLLWCHCRLPQLHATEMEGKRLVTRKRAEWKQTLSPLYIYDEPFHPFFLFSRTYDLTFFIKIAFPQKSGNLYSRHRGQRWPDRTDNK